MKGQLRFDEFMNVSEDKPATQETYYRPLMADPCYYCLCNSCIYNAESITVSPEEVPDDWDPCFLCDGCSKFDGKIGNRSLEKEYCDKYLIDNYHAAQRRKKLRVIT